MSDLSNGSRLLLTLLCDRKFHSKGKICKLLNVSAVCVNDHIKELQKIGVDLYTEQGRGYQFAHTTLWLDEEKIKAVSGAKNISVLLIVDSTNQWLLDKIPNLENGHTCIAEFQLAGRGRLGKKWISPFASHIYFSYYQAFNCSIEKLAGLSLLVGIATVNALEKSGIKGISLKWPNDIYYQNKKLAGILIELSASSKNICYTVIGIGLNVKMPASQGKQIDQSWTDLNTISHLDIDRNQLVAFLMTELACLLKDFEITGLRPYIDRWFKLDCFLGKQVNVIIADKITSGIYRGINTSGSLLIEQHGKTIIFTGGEVSLRLHNCNDNK
ncbi:MAG: bifunctional biotin--[acetyl-CoA-carboxylase] ligase/biotin operon repressor BirA [Psychromonas sp.]|nr:bifunctional biotin--[acetyl-CoA-carboxylase] ligase/biotin operon repressor BirA [Psychromonas sp.]